MPPRCGRNATGKMETAPQWLGERTVDAYGTNRQRLTDLAARNPGYRLLPDNFYGVEQSVVAAKGKKRKLLASMSAGIAGSVRC
jgi:hypothetical protein